MDVSQRTVIRFLGVFIASLGISIFLYVNTIPGDFVYDDLVVTEQSELRSWSGLWRVWSQPYVSGNQESGVWRPVTMTSFLVHFSGIGETPQSFHVSNIVLNGLVVYCVYLLLLTLKFPHTQALLIAGIFAFLPIHSEAVASIKARDELLATFFALSSWVFFNLATRRNGIHLRLLTVSVLLYIAGILAKETYIAVPGIIVFSYWVLRSPVKRNIWKVIITYTVAGIVYMFVRWQVLGAHTFGVISSPYTLNPLGYEPWGTRILTSASFIYYYVQKTLVPLNLAADYSFRTLPLVSSLIGSWSSLFGVLIVGGGVATILFSGLRKSIPGLGIIIFLVGIASVTQTVVLTVNMFADRWMYFPSLGIAVILGWIFLQIKKRSIRIYIVLLAALASWYSFITISRNTIWRNTETLYTSMVRDAPQNAHARFLLGVFYLEQGNLDEAEKQTEFGLNSIDSYPALTNLYGSILMEKGKYPEAEKYFYRTIQLSKEEPIGYINLAQLWLRMGEYQKACHGFTVFSRTNNPGIRAVSERGLSAALQHLGRNTCDE